MIRWILNLFKRRPYKERLEALCRREHDSAGRDIARTPDTPTRFEPLEWDGELPVMQEPAGRTGDGMWWGWIGNVRAGGAQETRPPYRTYLYAPEGQMPNKRVTKHEYGHKHLIVRLAIMGHDKRYDWCFWLWAHSRRMTDRVLATVRHPLAKRTTFRVVRRGSLLIDAIEEEQQGD